MGRSSPCTGFPLCGRNDQKHVVGGWRKVTSDPQGNNLLPFVRFSCPDLDTESITVFPDGTYGAAANALREEGAEVAKVSDQRDTEDFVEADIQ